MFENILHIIICTYLFYNECTHKAAALFLLSRCEESCCESSFLFLQPSLLPVPSVEIFASQFLDRFHHYNNDWKPATTMMTSTGV